LCVLVWDLKHWKIWQQWMKTHYEKKSEINLSVDAYRKLLLNFDDNDFIQEALHIFSSSAAQVSRIFILVDDSIEPSALAECVGVDLMQTWFCVALPQLVFIYAQKIKVKSMFLKRIHYASVESIFQNSQIASAHYFSNLFNLIFKGASGFTTCFHGFGPDIRNIICSGKLVITSKFIPKKKKCFSREQLAKSYENVVEQSSLKQPQHFILYSMINDWPSRPVSQNPGKKIFFFTPEISGFSSTLDWIFESLIAAPEGLDDIVPILIRIPKIFHETGLAESQYLLFALHSAVYETLSSPPFNFEGGIDSNIDASSDSPEHLMESLSKILSVACKQLCIRILIMIDNIHYIKFDTDSMGCIHWALSRMPENVRIVFPFLLKSPLHSALKTYIGSIQKSSLADSSDIALLEGLEYRKVPVFTSHQRYFFGCFVKSGTAYRLAAEKLCEDYFSWHLQVNSNIEHHIWLLIATGYVMIHRIWNIGIKPIDSVLSSDLKSMVAFIIQDFSSVLSGTTMLTAVRIMAAAKYGITMIDVIKIMMILSGHREEIYKQQYEYHQMCRILFQFSGQAQALERFCCIFARTEGKGFSMSNLLLMHRLVHQLLNEVILELHAAILDVPTSDALSFIILDFLQASCNMKPVENSKTARRSGVIIEGDGNFISQTCVLGQHRHLLILTDFAMHIGDTKFFLSALNNIGLIQSRIVLGCIHWVLGNILQVMRMVESYQESEMKMVFLLFRSLLNHRSRTMVLEIQPDLYYSILSTIPHKELLCKAALDFLQLSHLPWLRLANKQEYFQFPIIQFSDLPFAATTVATSKRGHLIGAGDFSGNIAVWRVSSSDLLSIFKSHSRSITGIAFSSLDYIVISCSSDNSININSVYSSSVLTTLNPHNQPVICLDIWSKDSDTFASVSRDGLAAVATLNLRAIAARSTAWKAVQSRQAQSEFSDEELGSLLLQPSSFVFTFQVSSFDVMAENVHTNFVDCIACHPTDREVCATGSRDSSIFIWKVDFVHSCSSCLFRYLGHNHWILSLDWMQTGYTLLSSSMSSDIHVWHIPLESNCKQHSVPQSAIDAAFSAKAEKSYDAKSGSPVKDQALLHHGIVRGSLHPEVTEHTTFSLTLQDACDFSEFDGARIFMEREEREITLPSFAVLERSALGTSLAMRYVSVLVLFFFAEG
jgi:WD40 repeat protein